MRWWVILFILMGVPVAEGTLSPSGEIEHWRQSGIDSNFVHRFVKNELCAKNETWATACRRGFERGLRLIASDDSGKSLKAEWDQRTLPVDYEAWITKLEGSETAVPKAMLWGYIVNGILSTFDAHARIRPNGMFFEILGAGAHDEIGLGFQPEIDTDGVTIRRVFPNTPALEAGIKVNDRLVSVDGEPVKGGLEALPSIRKLRGELNRTVKLEVLRNGLRLEKTMHLRKISQPDVAFRSLKIMKRRVVVIAPYVFNQGICDSVQNYVREAHKQKADAIILDLRFNPGGLLSEATCLAKIFTGDQRLIFQNFLKQSLLPEEFDLRPKVLTETLPEESMLLPETQDLKTPLAVLINASSASVSEMVAAALQDLERAWLVGIPSFGKGTFQLNALLHFAPQLRLTHTIFEVLRLKGQAIQMKGITPNFEVPFEKSDAARQYLRERNYFPYAVAPTPTPDWTETRVEAKADIESCLKEKNLPVTYAKIMITIDGFADEQQSFAMAVLHCEHGR